MMITLELSAEEMRALRGIAEAAGVDLQTVLHGLIAQISLPDREASPALAPSADASVEQKREQEEVEANIKRWHEERVPA